MKTEYARVIHLEVNVPAGTEPGIVQVLKWKHRPLYMWKVSMCVQN